MEIEKHFPKVVDRLVDLMTVAAYARAAQICTHCHNSLLSVMMWVTDTQKGTQLICGACGREGVKHVKH